MQTIQPPDQSTVSAGPTMAQAAGIAAAAVIGTFLRYQRWIDETQQPWWRKLIWYRMVFDILGAPVFGIIALGVYYGFWEGRVDIWVAAALAGFMGMSGPPILTAIATKYLGVGNETRDPSAR